MNVHTPNIITVASGKGGVGKTSFTLNMAHVLATHGGKVLVVDGDTGLANADVQLNLTPKASLADVLAHRCTLAEAITPTPHGFHLLAGSSGHMGLATLALPTLAGWMNELHSLGETYSTILVDAAAGISPTTLLMCAQSSRALLLTTPDPASLTDAYALIKVLWQQHGVNNTQVVMNQATAREAAQVHTRLAKAVEGFLQLPPPPLVGQVPQCKYWSQAVRSHQLVAQVFPKSPGVEALSSLARHVMALKP